MTSATNGTSVAEIYKTNLWWLADGWSDDALEWMTSAFTANEPSYLDLREEYFAEELLANLVPYLPELKPSIEWVVRYFTHLGDPHRDPRSYRLVDSVTPTKFSYDQSSELSEATQLLSYYMSGYLTAPTDSPSDAWLSNLSIGHRVGYLLEAIPFTQKDWDWLARADGSLDKLCSGIVCNPAVLNLETKEGSGQPLLDELFRASKQKAMKYLESAVEEAKLEVNELIHRSHLEKRDSKNLLLFEQNSAQDAVENLLRSSLITASQLTEIANIYEEAGEVVASINESVLKGGGRVDFRLMHVLCQILDGVRKHPNYPGGRLKVLERLLNFWGENHDYDHWDELPVNPYLRQEAGRMTAEGAKQWVHLILNRKGEFEDEAISNSEEMVAVLAAYNHFTPSDALEVFNKLILSEEAKSSERGLFIAVMLLPLISVGFKELRKQYDDAGRNIPLGWLLEASL